jgi:hypothetical protein
MCNKKLYVQEKLNPILSSDTMQDGTSSAVQLLERGVPREY